MKSALRTFLILALALCTSAGASAQKRIAVTIDDVPFLANTPITIEEAAALNRAILDTLRRHSVRAVGFVNEDRLLLPGKVDAGVAILDSWLDAGMELGNHNFGHVGLWKSTLAESQDAVLKGEVFTRWAAGRKGATLRYYRHPYTQTGKDEQERQAFESFLASRGYTVAPFTVEHDDYLFSCVYDKLQGPERDSLRAAVAEEFDAHLRQSIATFELMSDQLFGRQIAQILLIHATRLNADTLDRTLLTLQSLGYQFVSLEEALKDDAYRTPAPASRQFGPSWLARWARAKGVKLTAYGQPDPSGRAAALHKELCAK